jgi:uracil-DNA glycosylase
MSWLSEKYYPQRWLNKEYWKEYFQVADNDDGDDEKNEQDDDVYPWYNFIKQYIATSDSFRQLCAYIEEETLQKKRLCPSSSNDVFRSLVATPYPALRVVIVGQDPYPNPEHAMGLAFSTPSAVIPDSLQNILRVAYQSPEARKQLDTENSVVNGNLMSWARQGVLLWNTKLTCRVSNPRAHADRGWELLTERLLSYIAKDTNGLVFLFWGKDAQSYTPVVEQHAKSQNHLLLHTTHPSHRSASYGFLRCDHFRLANKWLRKQKRSTIVWESPYMVHRAALWIRDRWRFCLYKQRIQGHEPTRKRSKPTKDRTRDEEEDHPVKKRRETKERSASPQCQADGKVVVV